MTRSDPRLLALDRNIARLGGRHKLTDVQLWQVEEYEGEIAEDLASLRAGHGEPEGWE